MIKEEVGKASLSSHCYRVPLSKYVGLRRQVFLLSADLRSMIFDERIYPVDIVWTEDTIFQILYFPEGFDDVL